VKEEQMSRSRTASAEVLLAGFAGYLREQRGVSVLTVDALAGGAEGSFFSPRA
jgi:hypothetical protein